MDNERIMNRNGMEPAVTLNGTEMGSFFGTYRIYKSIRSVVELRVQNCRWPSANFRPFNEIGRSKLLTIGPHVRQN